MDSVNRVDRVRDEGEGGLTSGRGGRGCGLLSCKVMGAEPSSAVE